MGTNPQRRTKEKRLTNKANVKLSKTLNFAKQTQPFKKVREK